ncbi:MAG: hypothetical protein QW728_04240 [Thermoplasmata archaeon]
MTGSDYEACFAYPILFTNFTQEEGIPSGFGAYYPYIHSFINSRHEITGKATDTYLIENLTICAPVKYLEYNITVRKRTNPSNPYIWLGAWYSLYPAGKVEWEFESSSNIAFYGPKVQLNYQNTTDV